VSQGKRSKGGERERHDSHEKRDSQPRNIAALSNPGACSMEKIRLPTSFNSRTVFHRAASDALQTDGKLHGVDGHERQVDLVGALA
jgi:hypothetical protein